MNVRAAWFGPHGIALPHIALPADLPGITSAFAFRPETAKPMRELAELLLRAPSTVTSGERETIASFVSARRHLSQAEGAADELCGPHSLTRGERELIATSIHNAVVAPNGA